MGFLRRMFGLERKTRPFYEVLQEIYGTMAGASGEVVTPDTALKSSAVFSCVGLIAESVAMLPLKVYRRRRDGGRDEARDHPLWNILQNPNSWMTSFDLREFLVQHLALRGNAYAYIVRDLAGRVRELLPLHPSSVTVEQDRDWGLKYTIRLAGGGEQQASPGQMWHTRYRTLDGVSGVSPITYHADTIGLSMAALKHGARLFKNNARPGGVLSVQKTLTAEQIARLRESWTAYHSGDNVGGTAVLEEGTKFEPLTITNEDMQYLQTREFQVEDIARLYRVPLHMIQSTNKTTSWGSGIESMSIGFVTYTLMPWLRRLENTISRDLIDERERDSIYVEFQVNGLLRGDIKSRYESYQIAINNGFMSPNEVRSLENMNPRDGGDEYLTPLNMRVTGEDGGDAREGENDADNEA